jgi:hypothetical protein
VIAQKSAATRQGRRRQETVHTKVKDNGRWWLWRSLVVIATSQLYIVRELLAVFVMFALGFAAIAFVGACLYMLQYCWKIAVTRLVDIHQPVINVASVSRENEEAA